MRQAFWTPHGDGIILSSIPKALTASATVGLIVLAICVPTSSFAADVDFDRVKKLFETHCLECHNSNDRQGGLSIQNQAGFEEGSDSGNVIDHKQPLESLLLSSIEVVDGKAEMPKDRAPLSLEDRDLLKAWILEGGKWPANTELKKSGRDLNWWSLVPIKQMETPKLSPAERAWARNPIDAFIAEKHREKGLKPTPAADRRTLIRRVYYDLIGLPPSPDDVKVFLEDRSTLAYENLVEKLLASPAYGERWARHWLDIVHYGETHGYDKDKPRPNAWPYRDYVIRAFNRDEPYDRFIESQIAGDKLNGDSADGIEALGFLSAGPWDFIGHAEVPESKIDGKIARHLDRDDFIQNTMLTFQSITVGCAQCHNHKFDPVEQEEYYRLQSIFAAIDRSDVEYYRDPALQSRWLKLKGELEQASDVQRTLEQEVAKQGGTELENANQLVKEAESSAATVPPEYGYHSAIEANQSVEKWVQVDLGEATTIDSLRWIACHDDFGNIGDGFGFPIQYRIEVSNDETFAKDIVTAFVTEKDAPNPKCEWQSKKGIRASGRYVRFTATKLALRSNDYIFALSEIEVLNTEGKNVALGRPVTSLDSIEAPNRWQKSNLVDGLFPKKKIESNELELRIKARDELLRSKVEPSLLSKLEHANQQRTNLENGLKQLPPREKVYVGAVYRGSGAFTGTGAQGGKPRPIFLLARGDVKKPTQEVIPGALECFPQLAKHFEGQDLSQDGVRRVALANWISDRDNPLTWRSMANRVWHYHFGTGLVDTPNDFGKMGGTPSHPELLDYLANQLRAGDRSLKSLHRLIILSATYQQGSTGNEAAMEIDPGNRYLWKMNRRRLEAETIRDSLLSISDQLDRRMGGPSFEDFVVEHPEHSPHYEYRLHDPSDPKSMRRSVYRMIVRSQTQPFLTCLDCADPSIQVDRRNESNSALQALAMLNDKLALQVAQHYAKIMGDQKVSDKDAIELAYHRALSRPPRKEELEMLRAFVQKHGLVNGVRTILNLNEFIYVD